MGQLYDEYALVFKAISDESRLKIIDMLSCDNMCACDVLEKLDISQSTLSYHMKTLTECGLINATRDGSWMRYSINKNKFNETLAFLNKIAIEKEECSCEKC